MKQAKVLDASDVKRVLAVIQAARHAPRNRAIFLCTYYAGMRASEVGALTVGCVRRPDGEVTDRIVLAPTQTKGAQHRSVMVSMKLRRELKRYLDSIGDAPSSSPLFKSQKRRSIRMSGHSIVCLLARIYRQSGVSGATIHSGRRTFITKLASKGVSARVLQQLAGHKYLNTTQAYIDVNDDQMRQAVEIL